MQRSSFALARTYVERRQAEQQADKLIAANDNRKPTPRIRYRGTRPAWNWLKKQDKKAAAALWLVARRMLPSAANDNVEPGLNSIDRRRDGRPRGPDSKANNGEYASRLSDPTLPVWRGKIEGGYLARHRLEESRPLRRAEGYIARPSIAQRFGDPEPTASTYAGWHSDVITIKPQRPDYPFHADCRFGFCAPAIADGALFLGAASGLSEPKAGKRKGDARKVGEPVLPPMPGRIVATIEAMLARADLGGVGRALGYNGGYADRAGGVAMREAGRWAVAALKAA